MGPAHVGQVDPEIRKGFVVRGTQEIFGHGIVDAVVIRQKFLNDIKDKNLEAAFGELTAHVCDAPHGSSLIFLYFAKGPDDGCPDQGPGDIVLCHF